MNLPAHGSSHRLQKRVAAQAVKASLEGVVNDIDTETGVRLGKRQVEQLVYAAAQDFDVFYAQGCADEVQQHVHAKPIQVLTFDGKGVVRRPEALREATRKKAEGSAQRPPRGFARQEKSNRKRMATVRASLTLLVLCALRTRWRGSLRPCGWFPAKGTPLPSPWAKSGGPVWKSL